MIATKHYLNLNYVCNERCTFCAADLTNNLPSPRLPRQIPYTAAVKWLSESPPLPHDRVLLAGGEPTLHPNLFEIVAFCRRQGAEVTLFTNGVRLADPRYAEAAASSGIKRFEIALFGPDAASHEAITRLRGSFEKTIQALQHLCALKSTYQLIVEVRLLVSRQCYEVNPRVVTSVHKNVARVDEFSLNRLILSDKARSVDAAISWGVARQAINQTATLVLDYGYNLGFAAVPLCVFDNEVADHVERETIKTLCQMDAGSRPSGWKLRYLDPLVVAGVPGGKSSLAPTITPDACWQCDYQKVCGRVEDWYLARFGEQGLTFCTPHRAYDSRSYNPVCDAQQS